MLIEFLEESGLELPLNQKMDLDKGFVQLKRENEELLARSDIGWCKFAIYAGDQELPAYEGECDFPVQEFHLVRVIKESLEKEGELEAAKSFLDDLNQSLPKYYRLKEKNIQSVKERKVPHILKKNKVSEQQETEERSQHVSKVTRKNKLPYLLALSIMLFLGTVQVFYVSTEINRSNQKITQLTRQLDEIKRQVNTQGQLDTFCRYFLTNYYSKESDEERYKQQNKAFLSSKLIDQLSPTETPVKSILSWQIQPKNNQWRVSYVLSLEEEGKQVTKKVKFTLKEKKEHYQVTELPELETFTINE